MKATVNFFGYFRDVVKEGRIQLTLPDGATLGDLVQALADRFGTRARQRLLREDGTLLTGVRLAIGNDFVDDLGFRLDHGESEVNISVMHEVAGGGPGEDVWIDTVCALCYSYCPIRVHRVDGVVVKIEGNPDDPATNGRICPKGLAGIMLLYDPNRINVPMKRTNPEKGIGIDPKWVPISWDEALEVVTAKLRNVLEDDPRKLLMIGSVMNLSLFRHIINFGTALGTPNFWNSGAGTHCGAAEHIMGAMLHHAWAWQPDPDHCEYFLNFGTPAGFGAHYANVAMTQRMAERRVKGMKHVVIDPWMGTAAEKADEWIPIRPGTDAALLLGMINLLVNEYGLYDAESLKHHTNAPYLIGPDGRYVRDGATRKPLVWDAVENRARPFDDPAIRDFALDGAYRVDGVVARPAFVLLREKVRTYTPEKVSEITTIPAVTIRRLAREFGEAARIGSTITLDGKQLPYRPVVVGYFKGPQGHRHAGLISIAFELLREVVGASAVPGSTLGNNACSLGHPETGLPRWGPKVGPDGLMALDTFAWPVPAYNPYPPRPARAPETVSLIECVPFPGSSSFPPLVMLEPEKYGLDYRIEVVLNAGSNFVMTTADPELVARAFKDCFIIHYALYPDESSELADLLLPDTCHLERLDIMPDWMCSGPPTGWWSYHLRQPVIEPLGERRQFERVTLELAERLGRRRDLYRILNAFHNLSGEQALDPSRTYTWEEIVDRRYQAWFGPRFGLAWFRENGVLAWPKRVEEVYWRPFASVRTPIYFEFFPRVGEEVEKIKQATGIPFDTADFQPLPDWKPCRSHEEARPDYDLYAIYFRTPFHSFAFTSNNPWLDEISRIDPYNFGININAKTAARKGIRDGDWIVVESAATGKTVRGQAKLVQGLHPEVLAIAGSGGHWSRYLPVATGKGKGANFEWLLPLSFEDTDTVSFNQDLCVKVKVSKDRP